MTDTRSIARDALFFVLYVGFGAAMFALSVALIMWSMYEAFDAVHAWAAIANVLGWIALPFLPAMYRNLTGRGFSLTSGDAFAA